MRKLLASFLTWLLNVIDPRVFELDFYFLDGSSSHKVHHMNTQINDTGSTVLVVYCASAAGNPTAYATANTGGPTPSWASSDPSIINVSPAEDGMSATISATGKLGTATITVSAGNLSATDDVTVVAGPAATLSLSESPGAGA